MAPRQRDWRSERKSRYRIGHVAEWIAAFALWAKGYRVLSRRYKVRSGEIDLIAVRRNVVSFVEVKFRRTREESESALRPRSARRLRNAADRWLAQRPRYHQFEHRFDAILIVPWHLPRHLTGAL